MESAEPKKDEVMAEEKVEEKPAGKYKIKINIKILL